MLMKGWAPTAIGYSAQGLCKFGFYEYFKDLYSTMAGEENAYKYECGAGCRVYYYSRACDAGLGRMRVATEK